MKKFLFIFLFLFSVLISLSAFAIERNTREGYAVPTFRDLVRSIVFVGGVDINDSKIADDYARIFYRDLYNKNYKNDIAWGKIRQKIISRVIEKKDFHRTLYEIPVTFKLGRYDFEHEYFPLFEAVKRKISIQNVGSLSLYSMEDFKVYGKLEDKVKSFPRQIFIHLRKPLTLTQLNVEQRYADRVLRLIGIETGEARKIFSRIRLRISGSDGMEFDTKGIPRSFAFFGDVMSVDFFYDSEMTKPIKEVSVRLHNDE